MILERVELHQVCQHENLVAELKPGLIGILGPNGAGKSNFVNMIRASLTGDFTVNPGVKDDNVRWGMPEDDYSAVTTSWLHGGTQFTVRRALKNTHNYLRIKGVDKELRGAKEITASIEQMLGLPKQILNFMFVEQWEMFAFISADPATRASMFSHLCGTAELERVYKQLGDQLKEDSSLVSGIVDNREDIKVRLLERRSRILTINKSIATFEKLVLDDNKLAKYAQYLRHVDRLQDLEVQLARCNDRLDTLVYRKDEALLPARVGVARDVDKLKARLATATKAAEKAAKSLKDVEQNAVKQARIDELKAVIAEVPIPVPPEPPKFKQKQKLQVELAETVTQLRFAEKLVATFDNDNVVECPVCATPTAKLQTKVEEARKNVVVLARQASELRETLKSIENHEQAMVMYTKHSHQQDNRKATARGELATITLAEVAEATVDVDNMKTLVATGAKLAADLGHLEKRYKEMTAELATIEGQIEILTADKQKLLDDIKAIKVSTVTSVKVRKAIENHESAKSEIRIYQARLSDLETANSVDNAEIARVTALLERSSTAQSWVTDLEATRQIAHRDNFQRLAAQAWLEEMVRGINNVLDDFESPFYVEATEDLSFVAIKPSGRRERAERLSGGEKVLLAMAFRFAVNALMAGDLGMMIMDEPTAGVDKSNVNNMADILKKVSTYTKDNGLQLLIITHDESLQRAFDQIIHINKSA